MPVLQQLPQVPEVFPSDRLLIEQNGTTAVVTVGTLLEGLQPELLLAGGSLLGRASPGMGIPETIGVGAGLILSGGQLTADGALLAPLASPTFTGHPTAPTPPANDSSNAVATTAFVMSHAAPSTSVLLSGDVNGSGQTGTQITTTLPSIAAPGTYSKVTVNAKGQVLSGGAVAANDVAGLATVARTGAYADLVGGYSLPVANGGTLGGVKIGSGLTAAGDGTLTLASAIPAVDGSAVKVAAGVSGAIARPLSEIRGEVIRVSDLLGAKPAGQDATNAIVLAMSLAASMPGSTVELAAGDWNFASLTGSLLVPGRTTIRGAGRHLTRVTWNDTGTFPLFRSASTGSPRIADVEFADFTVTGSWTANREGSTFPFLLRFIDGLSFRNICSEYSRVMGIVARSCTNVLVTNCVVRYCARDGINMAECTNVTIDGNTVEHCDDDGIAVHSDIFDPWVVRKNVVISNNRVFGCQGIKVLAPRATAVVGNVVDCCRAQGISFATEPLNGVNTEGMSAAMVSLICGNVITNIINRANIDGLNGNCPGIIITGDSARAGSLGAIPGENRTSNATIVDPYPYYATNSNQANVATMGSHSLILADNFIGRVLPACNGTVTTPKVYARYSDYGFGQMFTRSGWLNPQLAESDMRDHAIVLQAGVVRDVLVTGNIIRGMTSGMYLAPAARLENIVFRGNQVIDCRSYGVLVNTSGTLRAYVEQNLFDLDPFFRAANRGANGTWSSLGEPTGIKAQSGSGVVVRGNVFRNMCRDSDIATDTATNGWLFEGNIVEADPTTTGFSTANKGVGHIRAAAGTLLNQAESDPGSANFGRMLTTPAGASITMPAAGKWLSGHFVRNAAPVLSGGLVTLGWSRLTTGSSNAVGTDWAAVQALGGSVASSLVLAGPASGSATPAFRQLAAADLPDLLPVPAVTNTYTASGPILPTDNVAVVDAETTVDMTVGAGMADGHQLVVKRIGAGVVRVKATIDGTAATIIRMNSTTLKESASLAWSSGLATWLLL
jgi:parallel beta-helix repeat protein